MPEVSITALSVKKVNPNHGAFLQLIGSVGDSSGDGAEDDGSGGSSAASSLGAVSFEWTKTEGDDPNVGSGCDSSVNCEYDMKTFSEEPACIARRLCCCANKYSYGQRSSPS